MLALQNLEQVLAALAEGSRLRLLALCASGERAVGELATVLGQSEPRVSRHLKILAAAGLVERRRDGHRVCYRAVHAGDAAEILRTVLARLDTGDGTVRRDASRRTPGEALEGPMPVESRLGRALRAALHVEPARGRVAGASGESGRTLLLGARHLELIAAAAELDPAATVVAESAAAADIARAWIERRAQAPRCRVATRIPRTGERWQTVLLDRSEGRVPPLETALLDAQALLPVGGRLWLFEPYAALEEQAQESTPAHAPVHPLARLRQRLAARGFRCERIQPLQAQGIHVLATLATLEERPEAELEASGAALVAPQRLAAPRSPLP